MSLFFGNPEQNMHIVTISFTQERKLLFEGDGHSLLPEMKGHGLNHMEANSLRKSGWGLFHLVVHMDTWLERGHAGLGPYGGA